MKTLFGLLASLVIVLAVSPAGAADCGSMAAGSLSRLECERLAVKIDQQQKTDAALREASRTTIHSPEVDEIQATCGDITDKAFLAVCRRVAGEALLKRRAEAARAQAIEEARQEAERQRWLDSHRTTTCTTFSGWRSSSTSCSTW